MIHIDPSGHATVKSSYTGSYEVNNGLIVVDINTNTVTYGVRGNIPVRNARILQTDNGPILVGESVSRISYTVDQYTFTNLNISVYANANGSGYSTDPARAAQNQGSQAFIATGSSTELSTIRQLSGLDDKHKYDQAWDWTKVAISGASDIVAVAKVFKISKAATSTKDKVWSSIKTLFVPGAEDFAVTAVDAYRGEDPDATWLTGLIPIYGTYQAYLDATTNRPLGVFVGR